MERLAKIVSVLLILPALILAQGGSVKLVIADKDTIAVKDFLVKEGKAYLGADEALAGLGLKPSLSSDKNTLFLMIEGKLVTVDLKSGQAASGNNQFRFSGSLRENDKLYLSEDFFSEVYGRLKNVKVKVEKSELGVNELGLRLPEKFKKDPVDAVVIDPGHGGENYGANTADGWREKDLTLKLAKKTRDYLRNYPELKVYLTRDEDHYLGLDSRTEFANKLGADLFLSIHINGCNTLSASGFETFFASLKASDDESRKLAIWENLELSGSDPNGVPGKEDRSDLELILGDMAQTEYMAESDFIARLVQKNLDFAMQQTINRGLRQAPFRVLMTANMPAVLVEVGFLTNASDRRNITDPGNQDKIAWALAKSILQYRELKARQLGIRGNHEIGKEKSKSTPKSGDQNRSP